MAATRKRATKLRAPTVKEALRREIGDALRTLRSPALDDDAVHRARKALKRARANLRLLRPALGERVYARENAALREAARPLGSLRDAKVIVDTLDKVVDTEKNASRRALLVKLRGAVEAARAAAWQDLHANGTAASSAAALERVWRRVDRRSVPPKGASLLREGVERIYRKGRKALLAARSECTPETLHEWRKHVKYLGNAMTSLGGEEARRLTKMVQRLQALAESLGDEHDLIVLQEQVTRLHSRSNARTGLFGEIGERRKALQAQALLAGRDLYKAKPRTFVRRVRATI